MKKNLLFFCLMGYANQCFVASSSPMFSILSWNILGPNTQDVADFGFRKNDYTRLDTILEKIKDLRASILCFQEVDIQARDQLQNKLLKNYELVAYHEKGKNGGVALFAKRSDFKVRFKSSLNLPVGNFGGAAATGLLESLKTNALFLISSVHISRSNNASGKGDGEAQLKLLQDNLNKLVPDQSKIHKIFAGDFNTSGSEIINETIPFLGEIDGKAYTEAFPNAITSNNSTGIVGTIDHIIYSQELKMVAKYSQVAKLISGNCIYQEYPSDHLFLYAVFYDPIVQPVVQSGAALKPVVTKTSVAQPNNILKPKMTRNDWLMKYKNKIDFMMQNFDAFILQQILHTDATIDQFLEQFEIDQLEMKDAMLLKQEIVDAFKLRLKIIF